MDILTSTTPPTYDVWTWPGWGAISAWASILALVTVAVAAWRYIVQRRQAPPFVLGWDVLGTQTRDGKTYHLVEFVNSGRSFGYVDVITFANAHVHLTDGHLAPKVVGSGQSFRLLITAPVIANVWLQTMTREPGNFTSMVLRWEPLLQSGELYEQHSAELDAWAKRSLVQRWKDRYRPRAVAPGSQLVARVKAGRSDRVAAVMRFERPPILGSAAAGSVTPAELPYLGPAPRAPK